MDTEMEYEAYSNLTNIQNFYYGQSIFITGVTGLVGKVVLEKILRCCPGVGMIYVHMRPKKGLSAQQRLEKIFKLELFREVKKVFPLFWKKVSIVEGDITKDKLGLSFDDYEKIRQNVSIVLHVAASVNFVSPLKMAVQHNVIATKNVLDLCHEISNFKVLVHVSTAFVKREDDLSVLEEIPKTKVSPTQLLNALEWMDDKSQQAVTDYLLEGKFTTYLITKALAEVVVQEGQGNLPIAIVRPSYISSTWQDPFPGWVDTLQGLSGLLLAGAKGVLRTLLATKGVKMNVIPVDIVSNAIISSAWHVGINKPPQVYVVNCVMEYDKLPVADEEILEFAMKKRDEYPLVNMFRYPDCTIYYNKYAYRLHTIIDQWIPALIIDFFLFIFTGRIILTKIYAKIEFLYDLFFKLGKDPWIFRRENFVKLIKNLSEEDAKIFIMDTDNFDWIKYIEDCLESGRKFLAHEDPSNIPYARKKAKIWWAVTTTLKWLIISYLLYYIFNRSLFSPLYASFRERFHPLHH